MNKKVIIIGASGHGKVVADIVEKSKDQIVGFIDDNPELSGTFVGYPVLGKIEQYINYPETEFVVAIGNPVIRKNIVKKMNGVKWYTAIHPKAIISNIETRVGEGTVVMANAVINAGAKIGNHCIINTASVVEHDNLVEDYVHISVGAKVAGTVHIGESTWVGIGAVISNNLNICHDCMIGAGAVVVKNIIEPGTYIGVPARKRKVK